MRNKTWFMLTVALLLVFSMVWPGSIAVAQTPPSSVQWSPAGPDPDANGVTCLLDINNALYEGANNGVRVWSGTAWTPVGASSWPQAHGSAYAADSLADVDGTVYAGTGSSGVYALEGGAWTPVGASSWPQVSGSADEACNLADIGGTVYAGTGSSGVYALEGGAWTPVGASSWPSQDEACSLADVGGTLYAGTGSSGVYALSGGAWTPVGASSWPQASGSAAEADSLADVGGTLYAGTDQSGVFALSGGAWTQVGTAWPSQDEACSLADVGGTLYAGTGQSSVFALEGGAWTQVGAVPFPGSGYECYLACAGGILYCGGADYVFAWNGGAWTQTGSYNGLPEYNDYIVGGPTLEDVNGTVFAGTRYGVWSLDNGSWTQAGASSWPQANGYADEACSLADVGGTVYAGTASSGVYALEGGAWTQAGTWQSSDAAWCLACVDGTVYAGTYNMNQSTPEGDGMWSLDNGVWTQVGSGLDGNWVSSVVYDEGDGMVYAGTWGEGVCALDGGAWTPLSGSSNPNPGYVYSLADVGGAVYAGTGDFNGVLAWNGANWTQVDASSWPQAYGGQADAAFSLLYDEGDGTVYAGTASSGVYALEGGAWTKAGSMEGISSICISPETSETLYAGTADGVWAYVGPPEASTGAATAVTADSAVLSGHISANTLGFTTSYGFYYGTSPGNLTSEIPACNIDNTGAFSATASGLSPGTTYYYEAFATNNAGTGYGAGSSFTTGQQAAAATPSASPTGGDVANGATVTLSDTTPGATIYYTTDGSTPTTGSSNGASGVDLTITGSPGATVTVKAFAAAAGYSDSSTVTFSYIIQSSGAATGGGGGSVSPTSVTSTTGSASVDPSTGGTVSLGNGASAYIPAGALQGDTNATVSMQTSSSPQASPSGFMILGQVYQFTVNGQDHYDFNQPVTLTFTFGPSKVPAGETPSVYYYDDSTDQWVSIGGTVSGDTISVTVDHFTEYAVMAKAPKTAPASPTVKPTDIAGNWAYASIEKLVALGAITGYPGGTFRPDNDITRAEFVTVLVKALKLAPKSGPVFADTEGTWAQGYISTAAADGIVTGFNATHFGPNDPITREQMTAMVVRAAKLASATGELSFKDADTIDLWARGYVETAVKNGLVNGYPDNTFRPMGYATRAEAVTVIAGLLK